RVSPKGFLLAPGLFYSKRKGGFELTKHLSAQDLKFGRVSSPALLTVLRYPRICYSIGQYK
ncbi:hypothetical protein COY95_01960, partial [Candidatus Woesearchaeota archaeon CG_4_10_14_0_8_um_filter_47_5]